MAECPECGLTLEFEGVEEGEIVACPECTTELEIVSTNPLAVQPAPQEEEDWGE